ncbi:hypothetical protein M407DRAFT_180258 [Tulasnella calospora MUT 4182]|uniref:Uncharacterized protein n=1 Tax=Tulasnella calospora MUT 4182 TaxID=1051891 RepID=A0A0C3M4C7_9AGAM|nr:hypothetical protein M407DRAFT_180258 [Tulasnella calospora MUT 4182]
MRSSEGQRSDVPIHEERPQCPLHAKIGIVVVSNPHVTGTGEDQGQVAREEEPTNDGDSTHTPSTEHNPTRAQTLITASSSPATNSESTVSELPALEYTELPRWKPGLNIITPSQPSTSISKVASAQVHTSSYSETIGCRAVIPAESHSNDSV